jgi:hypothetical protein
MIYKTVATNDGLTPISNVVLNDATPSFTTYRAPATGVCTPGTQTVPVAGATGAVKCEVGKLDAGAVATMQFEVTMDQ